MEIGDTLSYLGMVLKLKEGYALVEMRNFIEKMLELSRESNLRAFMSPAGKDIFAVDTKASPLSEADRKQFNISVAKLCYLSKRSRLDILTAVGLLCTRVTRATVHDGMKLDAAFAPHPDAKLQTGLAVFMGQALVFAASRKQKCLSKSPTDSGLIALSDYVQFVELFAEFVAFITNTDITSPII